MCYFVVEIVITNCIEDSKENMLSLSAVEDVVCVCVLNRQDVCRAGCSGNIAKDPNVFELHSEVNDLKYIEDDKIVVKWNCFSTLLCDFCV
jgi:hypothetical protein